MAWTACSPHVLAGGSKVVELTCNGYLWLYKSWAVAYGAGACWFANGLRRVAACVDGERSPDRPLITRVQHAL
eukprot:6414290-Prymnesium_polylepis.1